MTLKAKVFIFPEDKENTPKAKSGPSLKFFHCLSLDEVFFRSLMNSQIFSYSFNPLAAHQIPALHRQKLVEWLLEACLKFSTIQVFFATIKIIDQFFIYFNQTLYPEDLQVIGACCFFIASKFLEVFPLRLEILMKKICLNKFKRSEILEMEKIVLETLKFQINFVNCLNFLEVFWGKIGFYSSFFEFSLKILIFLQMSYEILEFFDREVAVAVVYFVRFKMEEGVWDGEIEDWFCGKEFSEMVKDVGIERVERISEVIGGFYSTLHIRDIDVKRILVLIRDKLGVKKEGQFLEML
jgi:hypothetical protein